MLGTLTFSLMEWFFIVTIRFTISEVTYDFSLKLEVSYLLECIVSFEI